MKWAQYIKGLVAVIKSFLTFKQSPYQIITHAPEMIFAWIELKWMLQLTIFLSAVAWHCVGGGCSLPSPLLPLHRLQLGRDFSMDPLLQVKGWKLPGCHLLQAAVVLPASPPSLQSPSSKRRLLSTSLLSFPPQTYLWQRVHTWFAVQLSCGLSSSLLSLLCSLLTGRFISPYPPLSTSCKSLKAVCLTSC